MDWPYVVGKVLPNENYIVRKIIFNTAQFFHRIRLRKFTTDTPLENNYTNEKFRPDDDIVIPQDDLYNIAWEAQSNPSPLHDPKV